MVDLLGLERRLNERNDGWKYDLNMVFCALETSAIVEFVGTRINGEKRQTIKGEATEYIINILEREEA